MARHLTKEIIQTWTVDDVATNLLLEGFREDVVSKLKDEEISGKILLLLKDCDIAAMGLKTGPTVMLRDFLSAIISHPQQGLQLNIHSEQDSCSIGSNTTSPSGSNDSATATEIVTSPRLPASFNVIEILKATTVGDSIVSDYILRNEAYVTNDERMEIVRIMVHHLSKLSSGLYPPSETKLAMAKAIVSAFPCLGSNTGCSATSQSWDLYYHPRTQGFIDTRLKVLRSKLSPNERQRRPRHRSDQENDGAGGNGGAGGAEGSEGSGTTTNKRRRALVPNGFVPLEKLKDVTNLAETQFKVQWMKTHPPSTINRPTIFEYMEETFYYRESQMSKGVLVDATAVIDEYPRFIDFDSGKLMFADFEKKYPKAESFHLNFTSKFEKSLANIARIDGLEVPECSDDCLRALITCFRAMPSIQKIKRVDPDTLMERFFVTRKENSSLEDLIPHTNRASYLRQPFMLIYGSIEFPLSFNIVIDSHVIPCGSDCSIAFQNLFSAFYVFRLKFPQYLEGFYNFFAECVFKIATPHPSNAAFLATLTSHS